MLMWDRHMHLKNSRKNIKLKHRVICYIVFIMIFFTCWYDNNGRSVLLTSMMRCFSSSSVRKEGLYVSFDIVLPVPEWTQHKQSEKISNYTSMSQCLPKLLQLILKCSTCTQKKFMEWPLSLRKHLLSYLNINYVFGFGYITTELDSLTASSLGAQINDYHLNDDYWNKSIVLLCNIINCSKCLRHWKTKPSYSSWE